MLASDVDILTSNVAALKRNKDELDQSYQSLKLTLEDERMMNVECMKKLENDISVSIREKFSLSAAYK